MKKEIILSRDGMSLEDLVDIARGGVSVKLTRASEQRIDDARRMIDNWVREEKTIYGVTTGFGALSDVVISETNTRQLQENILKSHASGVGDAAQQQR